MATKATAVHAAITPESIAAIAAGADLSALETKEGEVDSPEVLAAKIATITASGFVEGDTEEKIVEKKESLAANTVDTPAEAEAKISALTTFPGTENKEDENVEDNKTKAAESTETDTSAVDLLKEQLSAKDEALLDAKMALKASEAVVAGFAETEDKLKMIVGRSINNMQVALSQAPTVKPESMASDLLLDLYGSVAPTFSEQFKVGGISTANASEQKKTKASITRLAVASLASVKK